MPVGNYIGKQIAGLEYRFILIPLGMLMGYFIVIAEPAVHVLKKQVEELRGHGITRYCFTGRKECVMALRGRKRWDRSCQSLLEDLDFLLSRYEEQAADC